MKICDERINGTKLVPRTDEQVCATVQRLERLTTNLLVRHRGRLAPSGPVTNDRERFQGACDRGADRDHTPGADETVPDTFLCHRADLIMLAVQDMVFDAFGRDRTECPSTDMKR